MKRTALWAAAAALFSATPAFAVGGHVGVQYTSSDLELLSAFELDAKEAEFELGFGHGRWGAQIDGAIGEFEDSPDTLTQFAGHLWYGGDGWRLGGVIGRTDLDSMGVEWVYGAEGTFDIGSNAVLFGTVHGGENDDGGYDTFNVDAGASYYFTPNLRLSGAIGLGEIDGGGSATETDTYNISAEYQPFSAPLSLTLGWSLFDADGAESESLRIGARWNFGASTLRDRDNIAPFSQPAGMWSRLSGIGF